MIGELFDNLIAAVSPSWGARRIASRIMCRELKSGELNRINKNHNPKNRGVNPQPREAQLASARGRDMYWSDPRVSKAGRFLASRIIGTGMKPQSLATKGGMPWLEFAELAEKLWAAVRNQLCYEGKPGKGGQSIDGMAVTNFNEMFATGDGITRRVALTPSRAASEGRLLPLAYSLYNSNQFVDYGSGGSPLLDKSKVPAGHQVFRGVERDDRGRTVAYHLYDSDPFDNAGVLSGYPDVKRWTADNIIHTYLQDFPGLVRGVTWLSPAVRPLRNADDLIENDILASIGAACFMGVITKDRPTGGFPSLPAKDGESNTDNDGRTISRFEPGMIATLKTGESFEGFNPNRNASDVDKSAGLSLRGAAAGIRGMKSSTLTQDYERGSFSSEIAADNDISFEHEVIQEYVAEAWYQNIYSDVILAGIGVGWFDSLFKGGSNYDNRQSLYRNIAFLTPAGWQGPVQKHLQPASAETASQVGITIGTANVPLACAEKGYRWRDVADGQIAYLKYVLDAATKAGVPEEMVAAFFMQQQQPEGKPATRDYGFPDVKGRLNGVFGVTH